MVLIIIREKIWGFIRGLYS